ncbi:MAG: ABC transporter substrate-binding protein [Gammaproteobacteria bacterium]
MRTMLNAGALLLAGLVAAPAMAADNEPEAVIRKASEEALAAIDGRQDELRKNTDELFAVVDEILLPIWDRKYSGQLVMGKYWRDASPAQRDRFITGLYRKLLRTYADAILNYRSDQLTILGTRGDLADGKVMVDSEVKLDDGTPVPVSYRLRKSKSGGDWLIYDVVVEGISYVANYRKQYAGEFRNKGIEGVLADLESGGEDEKDGEDKDEGAAG